jgi:iron complex transport system substrate-binding protein
MKIVSICPSNTELLTYLGLEEKIVALDDYSDWPPQLQHLPRVGPDLSIRMDEVEALEPDLVVASLSVPGMEKNIEELEKRYLPYIVLNPSSLEEIGRDILSLGQACGVEVQAKNVFYAYQEQLNMFRQAASQCKTTRRLYFEWWPKPIFTPGKKNWLTEVSELVGGTNVFADVPLASIQTDGNDVINRNPDYICLVWVGVHTEKVQPAVVKKRAGWEQLEAVQNDRIYVLEEALFCRPSPRLFEGILKLGRLLHPEVYESVSLLPPFNR